MLISHNPLIESISTNILCNASIYSGLFLKNTKKTEPEVVEGMPCKTCDLSFQVRPWAFGSSTTQLEGGARGKWSFRPSPDKGKTGASILTEAFRAGSSHGRARGADMDEPKSAFREVIRTCRKGEIVFSRTKREIGKAFWANDNGL